MTTTPSSCPTRSRGRHSSDCRSSRSPAASSRCTPHLPPAAERALPGPGASRPHRSWCCSRSTRSRATSDSPSPRGPPGMGTRCRAASRSRHPGRDGRHVPLAPPPCGAGRSALPGRSCRTGSRRSRRTTCNPRAGGTPTPHSPASLTGWRSKQSHPTSLAPRWSGCGSAAARASARRGHRRTIRSTRSPSSPAAPARPRR
mmetsp:Transcript_105644/g.251911  ORF Transcript_105644/g.251911 Transcript_105644/m.251911 type:complete len:201 (-) Transcript_105644:754-1356(-)